MVSDDLAGQLRAETRLLHRQVESSPFMARLLAGHTDRATYCLLLRNLHPIYQSMEAGAARLPVSSDLKRLFQDELLRLGALEADLDFLQGPQWRIDLPIVPAATAYSRHLDAIGAAEHHLLAAHAYVRYLGDLAGGQQLSGIVARSLRLTGAAGTAFYAFGTPADVQRLIRSFRSALNESGQSHARHVVDEAKRAFQMHGQLFAELDGE